jgi:RNA polymerase sigma-70 factor (ECF subfamily)
LIALKPQITIAELQQRICQNDQTAYKELFELFYNKLFRLAFIITKSRELSEEIVSDVFISIWRRREHVLEISNLRLYLYVSVKNTSLNYLAQLTKSGFVCLEELDFEPLQPFSNPEQMLVTKEMNQRLYKAIQSLPPRCRMIFKLVKEDGLSYKDAAAVLNLSVGTIDNQLVLAIKKLSKALFYSFSTSEKKI